MGRVLKKGVSYNPSNLLFNEDGTPKEGGREDLIDLAKDCFIGERICTFFKGFAGTDNVVEILPSPEGDPAIFYILNDLGNKVAFYEDFWFSVEERKLETEQPSFKPKDCD